MIATWVVQQKIMRGDWETVCTVTAKTKTDACTRFQHMNGSIRAVSEKQALADYLAGRADDYRKKVQ